MKGFESRSVLAVCPNCHALERFEGPHRVPEAEAWEVEHERVCAETRLQRQIDELEIRIARLERKTSSRRG